jgi:hypothetical protein
VAGVGIGSRGGQAHPVEIRQSFGPGIVPADPGIAQDDAANAPFGGMPGVVLAAIRARDDDVAAAIGGRVALLEQVPILTSLVMCGS